MEISKSSIWSIMKLIVEKTQFKNGEIVDGSIEINALAINRVNLSELFNSDYRFSEEEIKSGLYILDAIGYIDIETDKNKYYKSVSLTERGYAFYLNSLFTDAD